MPEQYLYRKINQPVTVERRFADHWLVRSGTTLYSAPVYVEGELPPDLLLMHPNFQPQEAPPPPQKVNVNTATADEMTAVLPGIGARSSKKLVERRPEEGYQSLNQLKQLNSDLRLDWGQVEGKIEF